MTISNYVPGQAATQDGSHLTGSALLPFLGSYSGGLSMGGPQFSSAIDDTGANQTQSGNGPAPTTVWSPTQSVTGGQGTIHGGLSDYLSSLGMTPQGQPDWNSFYKPSGTTHTERTGTGDNIIDQEVADPGTYDSAGASKAYNDWETGLAKQYGLDPNSQYFASYLGSNPTSDKGSNDTVDALYKLGADGSAAPVSAYNQHNDSGWVGFDRPFLINGAMTVGPAALSAGLASGWGGVVGAAGGAGEAGASAAYGSGLGTAAGEAGTAAGTTAGQDLAGGTDSANLGSDAHFYNGSSSLGNMGDGAAVPSMNLSAPSLSDYVNQAKSLYGDYQKAKGIWGTDPSSSAGQSTSPAGQASSLSNILSGMIGGGLSAGDKFRQQTMAQALREKAQGPGYATGPGWIG